MNAAHTAQFARLLTYNAAQQAASAYMLMFRGHHAEDLLARNRFAYLRAMLQSSTPHADWLDADTESRYVEAWSQPGALSGGLAYYRATPLHPPTAREPGAAGLNLRDADYQVAVKTLVLWGERDPYLLPALLDGLERFVPDLTVVRDPESSHWMVHEQPERVITQVRAFLQEHKL